MTGPTADYYSQMRWLPVRNDSGETVPAFAAMMVAGIDPDDGYTLVDKPDADGVNPAKVLFNAPFDILADADGQGTFEPVADVLVDGTPTDGHLGTAAGEWHLADGGGFVAWGEVSAGVYRVARAVPRAVIEVVTDFNPDTCEATLTEIAVLDAGEGGGEGEGEPSLDFSDPANSMYLTIV